jgi:hypothetical protein
MKLTILLLLDNCCRISPPSVHSRSNTTWSTTIPTLGRPTPLDPPLSTPCRQLSARWRGPTHLHPPISPLRRHPHLSDRLRRTAVSPSATSALPRQITSDRYMGATTTSLSRRTPRVVVILLPPNPQNGRPRPTSLFHLPPSPHYQSPRPPMQLILPCPPPSCRSRK